MKVFGYVRVSGESQVDKDGPVRQELAMKEFCAVSGLELSGFFSDLGVRGTVEGMDRPEFFYMLECAAGAGVKGIVVEKMDRLARDLIVSETMIRELRARGLSLFSADQGKVDLVSADADPSRKFVRQIFSAVAEYDKSCLVLKLRAARQRAKLRDGYCEGKKPYGKNKAEKLIFDLVVQLRHAGATWESIATLLNQDGVRKRNGKSNWSRSQLFEIFAHRIPPKDEE